MAGGRPKGEIWHMKDLLKLVTLVVVYMRVAVEDRGE